MYGGHCNENAGIVKVTFPIEISLICSFHVEVFLVLKIKEKYSRNNKSWCAAVELHNCVLV